MKKSKQEFYKNKMIPFRNLCLSFNRLLLYLLVLIPAFILLPGCKSNRSIIKAPIKEEGVEYLIRKLHDNEIKFNTFAGKFTIDYAIDRNRNDFKGQVRIVKDSLIWISFNQDLGIEIARFLISQDSVKFVDRFNKAYFSGDYQLVNNFLSANIDFGILQSLVLGNDFEYYEDDTFRASIDNRKYKLSTTGRNKLKKHVRTMDDNTRLLLQTIWLDPELFKITEIKLKELTRDSKKLTALYEDFQNIDKQKFPYRVTFSVEADKPVSVLMKYVKVTLDEEVSMPFSIPDTYSRIY
ncbi:MAG TPA: DUF4292 domain-containing protein [Bacteroidales bacterium]|nr:DUF4292 domain-containing protein [Bacteroidales bacterium]HPR57077.1 DUF4292 domain-containing protein [Bacteroidales bacterium]HRW96215.1 DUF4292 domain-containing protein [Bacteroidales bacterium]